METSYFYSDNLNLGDIENVLSRFASEKKQSIYFLRTPKGDTENTTYQSVMILSPGYKIALVNLETDPQIFDDYIYDIEMSVSHLYKTYEYEKVLGRFKAIWSHVVDSSMTKRNLSDISDLFYRLRITDPKYNKWATIIISLCTGSINDIERVKAEVPTTLLDKVKQKIQLFDADQTRFIYQNKGEGKRVKIQGLSGTGKTELLLHKLKELYTNNSKPKIFVTCHNKILADSLSKKIPTFFNLMRVSEQIAWNERLWCTNAWGRYGDENSGLYRYICDFYGIVYYSYGKYTSFDDVCQNALSQIRGIANKKYALDYILVDECQDFPESFFKLCEEVTSQKLYIAGDIFQSIFEEHVISDYSADYFLTKCYRTDPRTLMFAHALGLGLFEKRKLRWLRKEDWEACGYIYTEDNDKISLTREPVRRFSDVEDDYKSVEIKTFKEEDVASATLEVINNIQSENSDISINDLCIILLDDDNYIYNWANQIEHEISVRLGWEVNKAYETKTVIKDQLLLSNRNNVKGLEFPFVICITNGLVARESYRNSLYTMLTRSFIKSYLIISEEQAENATKLRHNYDLINALKALKFDKLSVEQQKQVETRFKKLKNRRPLADEIRDYLKNKGVEEKLIDKMVETALGMGWQDLDEDELQKKLDSFILIYGE